MLDVPRYASSVCPECGARVMLRRLLAGEHTCDTADVVLHAGATLHVEIAQFLASASGERHLAFVRWCRERGRE